MSNWLTWLTTAVVVALFIIALIRHPQETGKALWGMVLWIKLVGLLCIIAFDKPRKQFIPTFKKACRATWDLGFQLLVSLWWLLTLAWNQIAGLLGRDKSMGNEHQLGAELEDGGDLLD